MVACLRVGRLRVRAFFPLPDHLTHDTSPLIPPKVLAEAQLERKKRKTKDILYIIRFFDKTQSWWALWGHAVAC
jgi:hypothetical protein